MATFADSFMADLNDLSDHVDGELAEIQVINSAADLDNVSNLQKSKRYIDLEEDESDLEYQLIVDCIALSVDIENEIMIIHNFIRDKYRLKFPELESLVKHPIDFARVVKKIGNEVDLTLVDLEQLLPSAIIMAVSITASTTRGKPLDAEDLGKIVEACDRVLALDSEKNKVLDYVESRMGFIAPNLSAIVGSAVAAKLIVAAGGLSGLANREYNVQLLGAKPNNLAGFSAANYKFRGGYMEQTEIFQSTPPALRKLASRQLALKSTLAASVDFTGGDLSGGVGRALREEILKKIENKQELHPARHVKPLPIPDVRQKKRRGGRRLRKMKERYAVTDMQKLRNRMQFGVPEESSLGDGLGVGYGMLRASIGQSKLAAKVTKKYGGRSSASSFATSGFTSSLAFTPFQGIQLANPAN
ncbi:U4/U6 small nuclear ribonucleoprotein Prp31 homolog [Daucus carota subsp. sativus]